jgi:hypothetical protein
VANKTTMVKALTNQKKVKVEQEFYYLLDQGWEEQLFSLQISYFRGNKKYPQNPTNKQPKMETFFCSHWLTFWESN